MDTTARCDTPQGSDPHRDEMLVVVAPDEARATIEATYRDLCNGHTPARVSFTWGTPADPDEPDPVLVQAGPFLIWAFDPYEGARLERALYGSEVGCRLGDD